MCLKASVRKTETKKTVYMLQGYFFKDTYTNNLKDRERQDMLRNWIDIKDDLVVIDEEIGEAM